jgi:hypothetical protein
MRCDRPSSRMTRCCAPPRLMPVDRRAHFTFDDPRAQQRCRVQVERLKNRGQFDINEAARGLGLSPEVPAIVRVRREWQRAPLCTPAG